MSRLRIAGLISNMPLWGRGSRLHGRNLEGLKLALSMNLVNAAERIPGAIWIGSTILRILRRILVTVVVTATIIFLGFSWVAPVALSFYAARKVPPVARVVPMDLKDTSVSQAPGTKLSYFGYEFEVPWNDLDEAQTKLYPLNNPVKSAALLTFRSGLRVKVSAIPAHEWAGSSDPDSRSVPRVVAANFGLDAVQTDYSIAKSVYAFSPDRMHYWAWRPGVHYREQALLIIKSIMLLAPSDTGIFNIQNQEFKGFQQGDPQVHQARLEFDLYSDEGSVEFIFSQKNMGSPGITQPDINRIVQTVHRVPLGAASTPAVAQK